MTPTKLEIAGRDALASLMGEHDMGPHGGPLNSWAHCTCEQARIIRDLAQALSEAVAARMKGAA